MAIFGQAPVRAVIHDRLVNPDQIRRILEVTDELQLDRDAVVIPLMGSDAPREMVLPDGKLLVRPPAGAAFDEWFAGFAARLDGMNLRKVPRRGVRRP